MLTQFSRWEVLKYSIIKPGKKHNSAIFIDYQHEKGQNDENIFLRNNKTLTDI